jgi:flagellar protein FlaG
MVAQVIKLSDVTTNNYQTSPKNPVVEVNNTSTNGVKVKSEKAQQVAEQAELNIKDVRDAAKELNVFTEKLQTNLKFSVDEGSGRSVITVTDTQSGDTIRQIPAKEALAVANIIRDAIAADIEKVGLLLAEQG